VGFSENLVHPLPDSLGGLCGQHPAIWTWAASTFQNVIQVFTRELLLFGIPNASDVFAGIESSDRIRVTANLSHYIAPC
jgi:hypothetical protein